MNLNEFVVLPNSKAKSVKLNVRNLQEMQMETVTLAQESKEMEEKLQQLKDSMSREKEERGLSGGVRWKSGKPGPLNGNCVNSVKKSKENRLQKLSAGKVKVRVLKDEQLTATPPLPPPPAPAISLQMTRQNRLRGTQCGQCEVRSAGLTCAECTEDYCIGCFAKFHQKGALKLHRMIPIQTHLQTHVSTRDVVNCFPKQMNPGTSPSTVTNLNHSPNSKPSPNHFMSIFNIGEVQSCRNGTETVANPVQQHPDLSQVLAVNQQEEKRIEINGEGPNRLTERAFPNTLLGGEYNEEESARFFQEALRQWRGKKAGGGAEPISEDTMWTSVQPVSAAATQADLSPDRGTEGPGKGEGRERVPVRVEFTEHSLTYMDRLLLKIHRRTPIKMYHPSLDFFADPNSLSKINPEEETTSSKTGQEEDFRRYCASLFAIPVSRGGAGPQITTPESFLTIEVLDESGSDTDGDFVAAQRTDNNNVKSGKFSAVQRTKTPGPRTGLSSGGSSGVSCFSPSPTQASRHSGTPAPPKSAQNLSKPQNIQAEHSKTSSSSKIKPPACPTSESPRMSKTSIKAPPSTSQAPTCTPTVQKSRLDLESPRLLSCSSLPHSQAQIFKSPHTPIVSFPPDVSPLASLRPLIPEDHLSASPSTSFSLRSTFTASPSGSTELTLLPEVYQSTPFQKGSNSSRLPEQPQFSQLLPETVLSLELSQSLSSSLESLRKSQQSLDEPESLLLVNKPKPPGPPVSSSQNLSSKSLEPSRVVKTLSGLSLFNESPSDAYYRHWSAPTNEDDPSLLLNVIQNPVTVKMEEEEKLLTDGADAMSCDSLAPYEEDSSDKEAKMHRSLTRGRSSKEAHRNRAVHEKREKYLQTDDQEHLSEAFMVMHKQSAGSGPDEFCDQDGCLPLGLDTYHPDTLEHTQTNQSAYDSGPTGSKPSSSLSTHTEEDLVFRMMMENHKRPPGSQVHPTTTTRGEEISANELGSNLSGKPTPNVSQVPAACCLSLPTPGSALGPALRALSPAAQEIMEICRVDQAGCEDPDLDTDTTANTLHELQQELRLMSKETGNHASVFGAPGSDSQDQHGSHHFTQGRTSEDHKEAEMAADRQSVLLLP